MITLQFFQFLDEESELVHYGLRHLPKAMQLISDRVETDFQLVF